MIDKLDTTAEYVVRAPTMDDLETVVGVIAAANLAEVGNEEVSLEEFRGEWESPGFNLATDALVIFNASGQAVGYADVADKWRPVTPWLSVFLPPQEDTETVGALLMDWAEARAREVFNRLEPDVRVAARCGTSSTYKPLQRTFEYAGFTCIRHSFRMVIDLDTPPPAPQWPEGITVRTAIMGQDERAILQAQRDSFQDHFGFVDMPFEEELERWLHAWQADGTFDPNLWFLAMDGDTIAGISLCSPYHTGHEEMGWLGTLGVTRPYRKHGLGLALLHHTFTEFYQRGKKQVGLGVDASNLTGALRLYERAGMHVAVRFDMYEKELRPGRDITRQTLAAD